MTNSTPPPSKNGPLEELRLDKWLWCVRVFKTRTLATTACNRNKVKVSSQDAKPSRVLRVGDEISVQMEFLTRQLRVKGFPASRVGAKLLPDYLEDLTPKEAIAKAAEIRLVERLAKPKFEAGIGRPDKKQLRELRKWIESSETGESEPEAP